MTDALEASRRLRVPLLALGGDFMTSKEMENRAERFTMPGNALYLRGRVAPLGELTAQAAHGLLAIFPDYAVEGTWSRTHDLPASFAAAAYQGACEDWGAKHLAGADGLEETADAMLRVVDGAWTGTLPIVDGWKRAERPTRPPALTAYAAMLLRELRGGLHFAALAVRGLPVPLAVLADPLGGVPRLLRTGWREELADQLAARFTESHVELWRSAEEDTDRAFAARLQAALGDVGAVELADRVEALHALSR
jgi:hypothetical protein